MDPSLPPLPKEEDKKPPPWNGPLVLRSFFDGQTDLFPFYPHFYKHTLTPSLKQYYGNNGHLSLLKTLYVEVVSDIERCRQLWHEFSPKESLFDTWEFRFAFWKGYGHRPYFFLIKTSLENLALLPLWYEPEKGKYFWFGSWWQEDNTLLVKNKIFVPLLLAVCPKPAHLNAIRQSENKLIGKYIELELDDPKYILDLTSFSEVEEFLANFKKKKRYNLRRDKKRIEALNPKITIDNFNNFKDLVRLSKKRFFEKGEDTDWEDPGRVETFRQVIRLGQKKASYRTRMITVTIGGKIAGVDLVCIYKDCYYPVKCGYDVKNFPGIGNYTNLLEIEDALSLGLKQMDFLEIGYGWKDKWFQEIPLFKYNKRGKSKSKANSEMKKPATEQY